MATTQGYWEARVAALKTAIEACETRGADVRSYTTEVQGLVARGIDQLYRDLAYAESMVSRRARGSMLGAIKFAPKGSNA